MAAVEQLISDHLDLWTAAINRKSAAGRGSSSKVELYGIKKLREFILDLAVRGLLVPQDPNDEPASELVKKMAAERAKLVKEGKIKKNKPPLPITDKEITFELPKGWEWVRIDDIGYDFGQKIPNISFTYIDVGAIDNRLGLIESPTILRADQAPSRARKLVKVGTVIYSTVRPYLRNIAIVQRDFDPEPIASTAFAVVHPFESVNSSYIYQYLRSPTFVSYVESVQTGIAYPAINDRQFFSGLFPLPPMEEQLRIAAKVDELMALCDQLEQQTDASLSAHQTLVETLLDTLTSAADHAQFLNSWQRIAEHFDTLFTSEERIDRLKKAIRQLAVMGKLVPQNPTDEPASKLYARTLELPAGYLRSNKQKIKGDAAIVPTNLPSLPKSWIRKTVDQLYRSKHILDYEDGNHGSLYPRPSDFSEEGVIFLTAAQIASDGEIAWDECQRLNLVYAKKLTKGWSTRGDVYFTHNATVGRTAIAINPPQNDFLLGTSVTLYRINDSSIDSKYLYLFFSSPEWYRQAAAVMQQTTRNQVSITKQALFTVALPPLAEQQRIAAKVEELMALCEQLKARLSDGQNIQLQLADALTEKALARA